MTMRRVKQSVLFVLVALTVACGPKTISDSPRGNAALKADAVVIRVNELQAVVIQACGPAMTCAPGTLSTDLARAIVQTCIDVRTTAKAVPDGWQASVKVAWTQAKPRFASVTNVAIQAGISAVDAIIGGL